jgi:hypothetical protein
MTNFIWGRRGKSDGTIIDTTLQGLGNLPLIQILVEFSVSMHSIFTKTSHVTQSLSKFESIHISTLLTFSILLQ